MHSLVVNYGNFAGRNTGIPEILEISTGTRNSGEIPVCCVLEISANSDSPPFFFAYCVLEIPPVNMCQVLSSDDGKGPKLNTLAKHYLPTSSADDCCIYDLKPGLPIDVFVLYLILLLQ